MATRLDDSDLRSGLESLQSKINDACYMYCDTVSKDFESYAKANRPWTDRTGNARQRLKGYADRVENGARACIAHGVDYGIWLEIAHEKRYAILEPTVRLKANDALRGMKELLSRIHR